MNWYSKAAEQGYANAESNIGGMYKVGTRRQAGLHGGDEVVP